jgi:hypothetical protein
MEFLFDHYSVKPELKDRFMLVNDINYKNLARG